MQLVLMQPQLRAGADNVDAIVSLLEAADVSLSAPDILVLPEHFHFAPNRDDYLADVARIARHFGCHVVGGSHHDHQATATYNSGVVVDPGGSVLGSYDKLRPYATEREWVSPGRAFGQLEVSGCKLLILICADFWFSDLYAMASELPDLVLVPALSVTRKPTPDYSRQLWRHLAIARAYEFGTYVGISDWGHPSELPALFSSGVGGFADPTTIDHRRLFSPIGDSGVCVVPVDLEALRQFRRDRIDRGFFWKPA